MYLLVEMVNKFIDWLRCQVGKCSCLNIYKEAFLPLDVLNVLYELVNYENNVTANHFPDLQRKISLNIFLDTVCVMFHLIHSTSICAYKACM